MCATLQWRVAKHAVRCFPAGVQRSSCLYCLSGALCSAGGIRWGAGDMCLWQCTGHAARPGVLAGYAGCLHMQLLLRA